MLELILLAVVAVLLFGVLRSLSAIQRELSLKRTGLFISDESLRRQKWERCFGSIAFPACKTRARISPAGLEIEISAIGFAVIYGNPRGRADGEIRRVHLTIRNRPEYFGLDPGSIGRVIDAGFALEFTAILDKESFHALKTHLVKSHNILGPEQMHIFPAPVALSFACHLHQKQNTGRLVELSQFQAANLVPGFTSHQLPVVSVPESEVAEFLKQILEAN